MEGSAGASQVNGAASVGKALGCFHLKQPADAHCEAGA